MLLVGSRQGAVSSGGPASGGGRVGRWFWMLSALALLTLVKLPTEFPSGPFCSH